MASETPVIDITNQPTSEEIEASNSGAYSPKGLGKMIMDFIKRAPAPVKIAGGIGVATAVGVAAYEIVRAQDIPSVFRNIDDTEVIGNNNIRGITKAQAQNSPYLRPQFDTEKQRLTYLFPFKLPSGVTATLDKSIRVRGGTDVAKKLGINDTPLIKFSDKGIEVIAPADSQMGLFQGNNNSGVDSSLADWLVLYHYDPSLNKTIAWSFTSTTGDKNAGFLPLFPMQDYFKDIVDAKKTNWQEELPTVKMGTSVMITTDANQTIDFRVSIYEGKNIDVSSKINPSTNFFTSSSNVNSYLTVIR